MPISDRQQQTLVELVGYIPRELLDQAKLVLRAYGIPYGDLEAASNVFDLYRAIEKHSTTFVDHDGLSLLQFMLHMVGVNADIVKRLGSDQKCLEACQKRSQFCGLVCRLCAGLSEEDYTHLKGLASDHIHVDSKAITSREELFQRCLSQEVLQKDDREFALFKKWLSALRRNDLVSEIDTYIREKAKDAPLLASSTRKAAHTYSIGAPSKLLSYTWFHDNINREVAEKRLHSVEFPCFLIRPSEMFKESLSLSLKDGTGEIQHFLIIRGPGWYEIERTLSRHASVPELVSYFKAHSLTGDPRHKLSFPCPKVDDSPMNALRCLSTSSEDSLEPQGEDQLLSPLPVVSSQKLMWRESPKLPVAMTHPRLVQIGKQIFVGGGHTTKTSSAYFIMKFEIATEVWSVYCECPTSCFGLAEWNGKLVTVGGVRNISDHSSPSNKVHVFDEVWFNGMIPPFKIARYSASAFSYKDNLIIAGGGVDAIGEVTIPTSSVEVYRGATGEWQSAASLPLRKEHRICSLPMCISNGRVYLVHYNLCMSIDLSTLVGESQSPGSNSTAPSSSWDVLACPLKCSAIAVVGDKLIAIGG